MRNIGARIRRYRLSRYDTGAGRRRRRVGWFVPLLLLWLIYAGLLGEHSWFRIWRLDRETRRIHAEQAATRDELDRLEHRLHDPGARRAMGERALRERSGFARRDETIYRIPPEDSLAR